ncbi:MAG: NAD(P)-dependent oxidoreductase [Hyphomicrobium sp.]
MAKVAFLGLGVMGFPMAGHLLTRGGHEVTVYNRSPARAQAWLEKFPTGKSAPTPQEAAKGAEFVFSCVGNDNDVRAVATGPQGAFSAMGKGCIFIDNTTTSAELARELSEKAASSGIFFIDAPVSGGQAGAENGVLTVMAGGDAQAYSRAEPVIANFARMVKLIGPSGAGQLTKMVNQIAIAGLVQGLSEAVHFAECAGLDVPAVIDTISKGAAQSWQMENRWKTMHAREFNFGFAVDWMRKDLGFCLSEAARNGAQLPVTAIVDGYYGEVQAAGGSRFDTSSLITRLTKKTG